MPTALVTGGGIRIGRAICLRLASEGFDVIVHANRSVDAARAVADEVGRIGRRAWVETEDLAESGAGERLARRVSASHSALDLVVHNAAQYKHVRFVDVGENDLLTMLRVNLMAPYFLTQGLLSLLRAAEAPSVVHVTDMAVSHAYTNTHFFSHYLASKAALDQLTRTLAVELGPAIRVNSVAPGPVAMAEETSPSQRAELMARVPLRREGHVDDVAAAVAYLSSARYVTGQTIRVDGGLSIA